MTHLLEIKKLSQTYDQKNFALNNINLSVQKGEFVVIIGPSGAGKSTLIRSINRMINPSSGEIQFDGEDMVTAKGKTLKKQRAKIGMIFQHYNLIGRTNVIKNVLHGCLGRMNFVKSSLGMYTSEDRLEAYELLKKVGLEKVEYKRACDLSGGQMQRVGICRAIMQQPKLILADEPIASLDPQSSTIIMDHLQEMTQARGITCLINLHQVEVAKKYDTRIIGVKAGKIVFDGAPSELTTGMIDNIYVGKKEEQIDSTKEKPLTLDEGNALYGEI